MKWADSSQRCRTKGQEVFEKGLRSVATKGVQIRTTVGHHLSQSERLSPREQLTLVSMEVKRKTLLPNEMEWWHNLSRAQHEDSKSALTETLVGSCFLQHQGKQRNHSISRCPSTQEPTKWATRSQHIYPVAKNESCYFSRKLMEWKSWHWVK